MILLTGGAGYIGSHTAVQLLESGYQVAIADNFSNSQLAVVSRIKQITGKSVFLYIIDVADRRSLAKIFNDNHINAVIHLAGYKAVGESIMHPVNYYRNNLDSTLSLLEVMAEYNVNCLIFSSSATVYGTPTKVPIPETAKVGDCTNPYGWSKYFIEQILTDTANVSPEMSVIILRYFNPVGAHESGLIGELPRGVPSNLMPYITQTAAGIRDKLHVFGNDYATRDGTCIRDYIHIMDLAQGHVAALEYSMRHSNTEVFNLGTGMGYSVLEVIKMFEHTTGIEVPFNFVPRRKGDIPECYADVTKAKKLLGWSSRKTLTDMCADAWRWEQTCIKNSPQNE